MFRYCKPFVLQIFILFFVGTSCQKQAGSNSNSSNGFSNKGSRYYLPLILSEDTLDKEKRNALVKQELLKLQRSGDTGNPYYHYFKGRELELSEYNDSALYHYRQMVADTSENDLAVLKQFLLFDAGMGNGRVVNSKTVTGILHAIRKAEKHRSIFLYRLYDLLAKSYYTQRNIGPCIEYTNLYFAHHPLRYSPIIRQRYFDISCMLAFSTGKKEAMRRYLDSARTLAQDIGDSLALMRTYDYESQISSSEGQFGKAVENSRLLFDYLKSHDILQMYAFNNLATSFEYNGQMDSAIHYYKEAITWSRQHPNTDLLWVYESLAEVYQKERDYKNATWALDSSIRIFGRNVDNAQAEKIEELRTQFQTEKKDQSIASLQATGRLNRKIISQQRWFFAGGLVITSMIGLYLYNRYRRKLLQERNEKLLIENKKLRLEQRVLQLQLNPHFVYNSIANLQGLICSGDKREAAAYLRAFSHVMRSTLELNREDVIPLKEEIEALENYIHLQQMRFKEAFEYIIETGDIAMEAVLIPPMLLQPFVENAIEHGFRNIDYKGNLRLSFIQKEDQLHISIYNNGTGVEKAGTSLKKSLSQSIIKERLDTLFNQEKRLAYFEARPEIMENGKGYLVNLYLPLLQS